MREINLTFDSFANRVLPIGITGENYALRVCIDCTDVFSEYANGHAALVVTPPAGTAYPGDIITVENTVIWEIKEIDLQAPGRGSAVLSIVNNSGTVLIQSTATTVIYGTVPSDVIPDQVEDWLKAASVALAEINQALIDVNSAIRSASEEGERVLASIPLDYITLALEVENFGDDIESLKTRVSNLEYKGMTISAFSVSPSMAEKGSMVTAATLSYTMNKVPASATLDGTARTISQASGSISLTGLTLNQNKTWTLAVTDERGATASKTATLSFASRVYYGTAAIPGSVNSAFILGLANKELTGTKARTITVNAGSGEYIWYAVPVSYGTCSFNVGGFDGGFEAPVTVSHTNASGYTENYYVYRSTNAALGSTTVKVS